MFTLVDPWWTRREAPREGIPVICVLAPLRAIPRRAIVTPCDLRRSE